MTSVRDFVRRPAAVGYLLREEVTRSVLLDEAARSHRVVAAPAGTPEDL